MIAKDNPLGKMQVLDLFSGIGGFSLGLERAGMETVAFCEFDPHAQKILKKHWPDVPIHSDVRSLNGHDFRGTVDVVTGGFPCQDLSTAGKQSGFGGERSSLYTEMLRVISECMPRYAIFENVTGMLTGDNGRWFGKFLYDLAQIGYDAEWHCIEAGYFGAAHRRDRVWVIAYPNSERQQGSRKKQVSRIANLSSQLGRAFKEVGRLPNITQPSFRGADDGIPRGMDRKRLARLGNSVVPQIPEAIGRAILKQQELIL
mgnify:FL=1